MIEKSQIENIQPEPLPGNELKADDTSVRPTIGNAVVVGSTVIPFKFFIMKHKHEYKDCRNLCNRLLREVRQMLISLNKS